MHNIASLLVVPLILCFATAASASTIVITVSGEIDAVFDNTGALNGSGVTAASTFTAMFTFDTAAIPHNNFDNGVTQVANYQTGSFAVTIDGVHTFTSSPSEIQVVNDDPNFYDTFHARPDMSVFAPVASPFTWNQNDSLIRLSLEDSSNSIFANAALPTASFFDLPLATFSRAELFIRTDLDRDNNQVWMISGTMTSMTASVQAVPEPSTHLAVLLGASLIVTWRRKVLASPSASSAGTKANG
jgi:hypothetical protein